MGQGEIQMKRLTQFDDFFFGENDQGHMDFKFSCFFDPRFGGKIGETCIF